MHAHMVSVARLTNDNKVEDIEEVTDKHDNAQAVQLERNLENKEIQQHLGQSTDKYNRALEPEREGGRERERERADSHSGQCSSNPRCRRHEC